MDSLLIWGGGLHLGQAPHGVVSHGTILTFGDNPTDFDVFNHGDLVRIRFEFLTDAGPTRAEYTTVQGSLTDHANPPTVRLRCFNVDAVSREFQGPIVSDGPVRVATVGGIALWLVYEVSSVIGSEFVKKIHYTLWDGPASGEGQNMIPGAPSA